MPQIFVKKMETPEEDDALRELATQAFNFSDSRWNSFPEIVGRENIRVAINQDRVVGGMAFYPIAQWFGGQSIPMAAFALVLTAPEYRGRGYALHMVSEVMQEVRTAGYPLATLHASTQTFYRKLGFEQAGNSYQYAASLNDIVGVKQTLPMWRVDPELKRDLLQSLATRRAMSNNGCLDRNEGMWKRVYRDLGRKVFTYVIGEPGAELGYLIYEQTRTATRSSPAEQQWEQRAINIRDMVALDADAMKTIWAFVAGNRPVTELVSWPGPAVDPRNVLTAEHESKVVRPGRWMLRLLDVRQALLQRGFPNMDAELSFDVHDDLIASNCGEFRLTLRNGVPEIEEGAAANPIRITARDFAPLYSGLWTAAQLQMVGKLACEDSRSVETATSVFAGSESWMPDAF